MSSHRHSRSSKRLPANDLLQLVRLMAREAARQHFDEPSRPADR